MNLSGKKNIFSLIFLSYFFIYALSPLSYTFTAKNDKAPHVTHNLNIFLWELVFTELVSRNDTSHTNSTDSILFRKARAILPQDTNTRNLPLENASAAESNSILFEKPLLRLAILFDSRSPSQDFCPFNSGLSPPAV